HTSCENANIYNYVDLVNATVGAKTKLYEEMSSEIIKLKEEVQELTEGKKFHEDEKVLFLLDKFCVSDEIYHELMLVSEELPRSYLIKQLRSNLNKTYHFLKHCVTFDLILLSGAKPLTRVWAPQEIGVAHNTVSKVWRDFCQRRRINLLPKGGDHSRKLSDELSSRNFYPDPAKIKFFDEAGVKIPEIGTRLYGSAPVGERPAIAVGDIVVMDNLAVHHFDGGEVLENFLAEMGVELLFIQTYSPDLNPI
ncbi:Hypothetical predicted protein, partial [Paramuricea clavata]